MANGMTQGTHELSKQTHYLCTRVLVLLQTEAAADTGVRQTDWGDIMMSLTMSICLICVAVPALTFSVFL